MDKPWPIEIDGLPSYKMGGSVHGELLNNQMVIHGIILMMGEFSWDIGGIFEGGIFIPSILSHMNRDNDD